ncbi:hypothetical protein FQA39_LY14468 [Lamprigera yunnana]|nr:hypothetical protein FQA39_LY14468 [Lamprigera yunnana]
MIRYSLTLLLFATIVHSEINNVCRNYIDYFTIQTNPNCWYDVAADKNAPGIITSYGYAVETHKVTGSDGYVSTLFRIINNNGAGRNVPVLLQHGLIASGASFVAIGNKSLGFLLADAGYDVWLGNMRGNQYSEEHLNLSSDNIKYWNYNIDDITFKDLPNQLKYILQKNSQNGKIIYIGHSLGCATALSFGSSYPKEVEKFVKLFILMAPDGGVTHTKSILLRVITPFMGTVVKLFINTEIAKSLSYHSTVNELIRSLCRQNPIFMSLCSNILNFLFTGPQYEMDASISPVVFNQLPDGTSLPVLKQATDHVRLGLSAYDYGLQNVAKYGSLQPPLYNVTKIEVPIFIAYSVGDWAVTEKDSENLYNRLSPQAKIYGKHKIEAKGFNHNDFLYAKTAKTLVYDKIVQLMESVRGV